MERVESEGRMSSKQNGFGICEGRRSFALMPAVIAYDKRHANMDLRPLTRAQIAAIPGVKFPTVRHNQGKPGATSGVYGYFTDAETASAVKLWHAGLRICDIADTINRAPSSVRTALNRVGIDTAARGQKAKSIAAKKKDAA